ncbi:hypothetical protein SK128_007690 [Halocaridina rubra]|uniref:Uncharacterized protein n=1 Tax=Halocaridina rubra TaxID=373956 RepID=A0AAN8XAW3_HALRR
MRGFIIEFVRVMVILILIGLTGLDIMYAFYHPTDLRWALFLFFIAIIWSLIRLKPYTQPDSNVNCLPIRIRYVRTYGACADQNNESSPSYESFTVTGLSNSDAGASGNSPGAKANPKGSENKEKDTPKSSHETKPNSTLTTPTASFSVSGTTSLFSPGTTSLYKHEVTSLYSPVTTSLSPSYSYIKLYN